MVHEITIDTCAINAKGQILAMNIIEKLNETEKIQMFTTDSMEEELTPGSVQWAKKTNYIEAMKKPDLHNYPLRFGQIKDAVFPTVSVLSQNQERDIHHLTTHLKYLHDFFLTYDKAILRAKEALAKLQIKVMTPEEYVKIHANP